MVSFKGVHGENARQRRVSPRQSMIDGHLCLLCNAGAGSPLSRVRVLCGWLYARGGEYHGRSLWL
jgi:hypothetical protein